MIALESLLVIGMNFIFGLFHKVIYHLQNSKFAILRYDTHYNGEEGDWQDFYVAEQYYTIMDILKGDTNMLCVLGPMLMNVEGK